MISDRTIAEVAALQESRRREYLAERKRAEQRGQLAEIINGETGMAFTSKTTADRILSAGYRPPPRVITDPDELDALPDLSIVLASKGIGWQMTDRDDDGSAIWEAGTSGETSVTLLAGGPVTVLHEPREETRG